VNYVTKNILGLLVVSFSFASFANANCSKQMEGDDWVVRDSRGFELGRSLSQARATEILTNAENSGRCSTAVVINPPVFPPVVINPPIVRPPVVVNPPIFPPVVVNPPIIVNPPVIVNPPIIDQPIHGNCLASICVGDAVPVKLYNSNASAAGYGTVLAFLSGNRVVMRGLDGANYTFDLRQVGSARINLGSLAIGDNTVTRIYNSNYDITGGGFGQIVGFFQDGDVALRSLDGAYYTFDRQNVASIRRGTRTGVYPGQTLYLSNGGYGTLIGMFDDGQAGSLGLDGVYYVVPERYF